MIGSISAARRSEQLKAQDAPSPPSPMRCNPVSVSCPVSSSKVVFTSVRTWRAIGASSCTAFLEMGFLVLASRRAAVCTVEEILKMSNETGDMRG